MQTTLAVGEAALTARKRWVSSNQVQIHDADFKQKFSVCMVYKNGCSLQVLYNEVNDMLLYHHDFDSIGEVDSEDEKTS